MLSVQHQARILLAIGKVMCVPLDLKEEGRHQRGLSHQFFDVQSYNC